MSFWSSFEDVSSLTNFLKWVVAICGILTTIAGVFLIIYSDRKDILKKQAEDLLNQQYDSTFTEQENEIDSLKIELKKLLSERSVYESLLKKVGIPRIRGNEGGLNPYFIEDSLELSYFTSKANIILGIRPVLKRGS